MVDGACCVFLFVVLFFFFASRANPPSPPRPGAASGDRRVSICISPGRESVLSLRSSSRLACATLCLTLIHVQHVCDV